MENKESLQTVPFHRALHRPQLIAGGERELMLLSILIAGTLIIASLDWIVAIVGILIWFICVYGLRKMAKIDPEMSKVYIRQLKYQDYYKPYSTIFRKSNSKTFY